VGVTDDETGAVEAGWSRVVRQLRVGEMTQFHVCRFDGDVKGRVWRDILVVFREGDQG